MTKIYWVDPEKIFVKGIPFNPLYDPKQYNDPTSLDLVHYLECLPSIALYGFKYVVTVNKAMKVMDGDYRVFAARELGIKLPIVIPRFHDKFLWKVSFHIQRQIRRLVGIQYLFFKKIKNPDFKYNKVLLTCKFQKNILYDPDLLQRKLETDKQILIRKLAIQSRERRLFYILINKLF